MGFARPGLGFRAFGLTCWSRHHRVLWPGTPSRGSWAAARAHAIVGRCVLEVNEGESVPGHSVSPRPIYPNTSTLKPTGLGLSAIAYVLAGAAMFRQGAYTHPCCQDRSSSGEQSLKSDNPVFPSGRDLPGARL